jgi:hypothetical protein
MTWFNVNQKALIEHAYGFNKKLPDNVWLKKY